MKKICNILFTAIISLLLVVGFVACTPTTGPKTYTVTFNTQGVCEVSSQTVKENELATRPSPDPVSEYYNFEGWYADSTFAVEYDFTSPIVKDTTVFAKWSVKESTYTITFDVNGRGKTPAKQYIEAGTNGKITKPADLSSNGWRFIGWSLSKEGKENLVDFDTFVPTSSVTLYAQWLRIITISFDLNHKEALTSPPDNQSVYEGELLTEPEVPTVPGLKFLGWYTDQACTEEFSFDTPISSKIMLYAKWEDNTVGSIDGSDLPAYEWREEAAYGERPDLEGYIIDGYMGEEENWEDMNWYSHGFTEAPTVKYKMTSQFSDKGLYLFIQAEDNGGLMFTGRGYHYKNTGMQLMIINGDTATVDTFQQTTIKFDTYNIRGGYCNYKIAIRVVEGQVNPTGTNKYGKWNTEIFFTWDELGFVDGRPETIRVVPWYFYKRIQADTYNLQMRPTLLTNTGSAEFKNFIEFDENGYTLADSENAVIGDSYYGIAKTNGWDISHIDDEENAYVQTTNIPISTTQAMFFKNVSGNYYEVSTDIEVPDPTKSSGSAGLIVYNSEILYSMMTFDINTQRVTADGFLSARPKFSLTNKDGNLVHTYLSEIVYERPQKKLNLKLLFSNGYVYYILNGKLFYCQFISTLTERTNPGIVSVSASQVRFSNYQYVVLNESEMRQKTAEYAYVVSAEKPQKLNIEFSEIGVDRNEPSPITMSFIHSSLTVSSNVKNKIIQDGDYSSVKLYELDSIYKSVGGADAVDVTADFIDPTNGIKYGQYVLNNIVGDTVFTNTARLVDTDTLTYVTAQLCNSQTGIKVSGTHTATIKSNNPRLSCYTTTVSAGNVFIVLPKGYYYEITINGEGYRPYKFERMFIDDVVDFGNLQYVPTVVGGTAISDDNKLFVASEAKNWDYTQEGDGIVNFVADRAGATTAYFSGYTMDKYQVAEVKISNLTDPAVNSIYERDPAAGFVINNLKTKYSYFIGLHQKGLRFLQQGVAWNPTHYHTLGYGTVNVYDPTGEYYNTLTMVKISRGEIMTLYIYVDGKYITTIDVSQMGGETAIGFTVTTSYYTKIKFFDYSLKLGDEALEIAKNLVGAQFDFDDTCYDYNYDTYEIDYNKPLITVDGFTEVIKDNGSKEQVAFAGQELNVKLNEEYVTEGIAYSVSIGNEKLVLTSEKPSAKFKLGNDLFGNVPVSISYANSATVTGKVVDEYGDPLSNVAGNFISDNGEIIGFKTGEDGTFTAYVIANRQYVVEILKDFTITIKKKMNVTASGKDWGIIETMPAQLGGKTANLTSSGTLTYGYDYSDTKGNVIAGPYTEVYHTGQAMQSYRGGNVGDFILDFSFFRTEIPGVESEHDPAVMIRLSNGTRADLFGFWRTGSLVLRNGSWSNNVNVQNKLSASVQSFNVQFDFKIIRKGTTFIFFGKTENEENYTLCSIYNSDVDFGFTDLGFAVTAGKPTNHFFYNLSITPLTAENAPEYLIENYSIDAGEGTATVKGSSFEEANKALVGDKLTIRVAPPQGKIVAYALVNGVITQADNNTLVYSILSDSENEIKFVYEEPYGYYDVTGTLEAIKGQTLPESATIIAYMEDGRQWTFDTQVDADGKFTLKNVREGNLKFYAKSPMFLSKSVALSVGEGSTDIGTIVLDVYNVGATKVNGTALGWSAYKYNPDLGEFISPGREGGSAYMPGTVTSGDFVFSCDVTLNTGNPNSPYYTPDFSTGFEFSNGKSNHDGVTTFGMLFTCDGFRVSHGGYSQTYMIESHNGLEYYYPRNNPKDVTHKFTLARLGTTLKVYVDDVLSMIISPEDGVKMYVDGKVVNIAHSPYVGGNQQHALAAENWIKNQVKSMFGENGGEIAIAYKVNINLSNAGVLNSAGYKNTTITTDPEVVAQYR